VLPVVEVFGVGPRALVLAGDSRPQLDTANSINLRAEGQGVGRPRVCAMRTAETHGGRHRHPPRRGPATVSGMAGEPAPEPAHPVLYLTKTWMFTWEQHRPGGCRCVCALYHQGPGACTAAADPGRLLRVVTPGVEDHASPADI